MKSTDAHICGFKGAVSRKDACGDRFKLKEPECLIRLNFFPLPKKSFDHLGVNTGKKEMIDSARSSNLICY